MQLNDRVSRPADLATHRSGIRGMSSIFPVFIAEPDVVHISGYHRRYSSDVLRLENSSFYQEGVDTVAHPIHVSGILV